MTRMKHSIRPWLLGLLSMLALASAPLQAQTGITQHQVQFAKGKSGTTIQGGLKGGETVDYKLRAAANQTMKVRKVSGGATVYFNVLAPGSQEALFVGSREGNEFGGTLPVGGEYTIRVYQMGNAKSSGQQSSFAIEVAISGGAGAATASTNHVERAGQGRFDATGKIPCAQAAGQPMGHCDFGVARAGGGTAAVAVTLADGRRRVIFFDKGKATGADLSQADGDMSFSAKKEADLYMIRAGKERYEIPEAVVFGG